MTTISLEILLCQDPGRVLSLEVVKGLMRQAVRSIIATVGVVNALQSYADLGLRPRPLARDPADRGRGACIARREWCF